MVLWFKLTLLKIAPGGIFRHSLPVSLHESCQIFERYPWTINLYYKQRKIEYNTKNIRVSPIYSPNLKEAKSADLCFFSSPELTRNQYVAWATIFSTFTLSFDIWDIERYEGISVHNPTGQPHELSWKGRYPGGILIITYANREFKNLHSNDLIGHYRGLDWKETGADAESGSSIIFCEFNKYDDLYEQLYQHAPRTPFVGSYFGGLHVMNPDRNDAAKKARSLVKESIKKDPQHHYRAEKMLLKFDKVGVGKWWYGSLDVARFPLRRGVSLISLSKDAANNLDTKEANDGNIILGSTFFSALAAVLLSLPIHKKMVLLMDEKLNEWKWKFLTNRGMIWIGIVLLAVLEELVLEFKESSNQLLPKFQTFAERVEFISWELEIQDKLKKQNVDAAVGDDTSTLSLEEKLAVLIIATLKRFKKQSMNPIFSIFNHSLRKKEAKKLTIRIIAALVPKVDGKEDKMGNEKIKNLKKKGGKVANSTQRIKFEEVFPLEYPLRKDIPIEAPNFRDSSTNAQGNEIQQWSLQTSCTACHANFSVIKLKHHCRNCGQTFCGQCAHHKYQIDSKGFYEPVRVCNTCFAQLSATNYQKKVGVKTCGVCSQNFNPVLRKKYLCKHCGQVVCDNCSPKKLHLPKEKSGTELPVRVCSKCFVELTTVQLEKQKSATKCKSCQKGFNGVTVRKHSCWKCGGVFCRTCTQNRYSMDNDVIKGQMTVCNSCYEDTIKSQRLLHSNSVDALITPRARSQKSLLASSEASIPVKELAKSVESHSAAEV
eukprot:TRINITY_DN4219_c0_g1_i1.p1 TRINITY_DN4219_c0_g1~~TRINITY_DN4219_c0_g1_i1.p1  ORF type:complete len:770 (-),score=165.96 TRINITY_DN4219_c0_g1_i1:35-2344(-)